MVGHSYKAQILIPLAMSQLAGNGVVGNLSGKTPIPENCKAP
jgi:hypothetical protein